MPKHRYQVEDKYGDSVFLSVEYRCAVALTILDCIGVVLLDVRSNICFLVKNSCKML